MFPLQKYTQKATKTTNNKSTKEENAHSTCCNSVVCLILIYFFAFFFQSSKLKSQFHISECNMRTFQLHLYFKMNHKVSVTVVYTHSIYFCRVLMVFVLCTPTSALNIFLLLFLFFHLSYIYWQGMFVSCSIRLYCCRRYHCHRHYGFISVFLNDVLLQFFLITMQFNWTDLVVSTILFHQLLSIHDCWLLSYLDFQPSFIYLCWTSFGELFLFAPIAEWIEFDFTGRLNCIVLTGCFSGVPYIFFYFHPFPRQNHHFEVQTFELNCNEDFYNAIHINQKHRFE